MRQLCCLHWKVQGHSPSGTSQQDCSYPSWAQEGGWGHPPCYLLLPCALLTNTASCKEGSGDPPVTASGSTLEKRCQEGAFWYLLFSTLQTQESWTTFCLMKAEETGLVFSDLTFLLGIPGINCWWHGDVTHVPGRSSKTVILFQARSGLAFQ